MSSQIDPFLQTIKSISELWWSAIFLVMPVLKIPVSVLRTRSGISY
jgi:hypothetical protein